MNLASCAGSRPNTDASRYIYAYHESYLLLAEVPLALARYWGEGWNLQSHETNPAPHGWLTVGMSQPAANSAASAFSASSFRPLPLGLKYTYINIIYILYVHTPESVVHWFVETLQFKLVRSRHLMAHNSVSQSMLCRPLNPSFRIGYSTGVKGALWRSASRQWERWWSIQNCEKISGSFFSPSENSSSTQAVHVLNVDTAASCSHSSAGTCPKVAARGRDSIHDTGSRCVLWTRSVQRQN